MIHALKYGGWWSIAAPLGARMAKLEFPQETTEEVRLVAPVPLSAARLRQRGYNQALLLATAVARASNLHLAPDLLRRVRSSGSQTSLHPSERRANVAGMFSVLDSDAETIRGEHVLIVDDVWTTGATAIACGEALVSQGARAFSVLTLARALPELNR